MTALQSPEQTFNKTECDFFSQNTRCSAWLYRPASVQKPPLVIMGSFLGGEKTFRLPAYAERFAQQGLAVLLFDYRNFGASDGEPRNLIDPWRHLQDWRAAINHVRSLSDIASAKLALWGSSFAGGHIIKLATEDHDIKAIVCQVPAVDGLASTLTKSSRYLATAVFAGLRDIASTLIWHKPYWVPIIASPDRFGILNTAECEAGYLALLDPASMWQNRAPARLFLKFPFYRPISVAHRVRCPALILGAEQDSLVPISGVEKTAAKIKNATLIRLPCNHFEPYQGEFFEQNVKLMTEFLSEHLLDQELI
jgi:pimeloyl-ACP methyl ester carboxylesterase